LYTGKISQSAINAAFARAAHLFFDAEPKIIRDDYAVRLSGLNDDDTFLAIFKENYSKLAHISEDNAKAFSQSYRALAVVRQRFIEDELLKMLKNGVSQYVILGSGLDSFVLRRLDLKSKLTVFEVDRPEVLEWKNSRLHELHISQPSNLISVPIDFEKQTLLNELKNRGFKDDAPTFFSWLGVTQYLNELSVYKTLSQITQTNPGNEIIFEYVLTDSLLKDSEKRITEGSRMMPQEPWICQFDTGRLIKRLKEMGFTEVLDFGPQEVYSLYLSSRTDNISRSALEKLPWSMLNIAHIMKASVHT
jgi:methyltransferase (TIGR00027 family)